MDIFVGNLPRKTSVLELRKLIDIAESARFRVISHRKNGRSSCYGHAMVNSKQTASEIISRLDGAEFNGSNIIARRFLHRSEHNERRARMVYPVGWNGVNRRRGDRRS